MRPEGGERGEGLGVVGTGEGTIEGEQAALGGVDDLDGEAGAGGAGGGAVEESGLDAREEGVEAGVGEAIEGAVGSETHGAAFFPRQRERRCRSGRRLPRVWAG